MVLLLHSQVFAHSLAGAAVTRGGPILFQDDFLIFLQLAQSLQTIHNELPRTIGFLVHFALAGCRSAAGAVEQALGAAGHGADAAGEVQNALAASLATLGPYSIFQSHANESRVDRREHYLCGESFGRVLDPRSTSHRNDGLVFIDKRL